MQNGGKWGKQCRNKEEEVNTNGGKCEVNNAERRRRRWMQIGGKRGKQCPNKEEEVVQNGGNKGKQCRNKEEEINAK